MSGVKDTVKTYFGKFTDEDIKSFLLEQRGKKFQPELVDILVNDYQSFLDIRTNLSD